MSTLPDPEHRSYFQVELFNRHSHAEIINDENPGAIIYEEHEVMELMRIVRDKTLEWAVKNVRMKTILDDEDRSWDPDSYTQVIDEDSILSGKRSKDLEI